MENSPKVSVIMGIYNCEKTLKDAIDSIINQTYTNWELILCDDGSTDGTYALAEKYAKQYPKKIILLHNEKNLKLACTLNHCLHAATGELIARMDGDDRSHPERLQKQVDVLLKNRDVQLVGTAMLRFDEAGCHEVMHPIIRPESRILIRSTPFYHATILTYKWVYDKLDGYCTEKRAERVEDVDLWFRFFAMGFSGVNLDEPLYEVRDDLNAFRRRTLTARIHSIRTRANGFKLLGFPLRQLIWPAIVLFSKGIVPSRLAAYLRRTKINRKE